MSTWSHRIFIIRRIMAGKFFRLLGSANTRLQPHELFSIKSGYHHALKAESFDDTGNMDEWQRSIYELAAEWARKLDNPSIIDVGCGSGYKLTHILGAFNTTGIEIKPAYDWLLQKYPNQKWLLFDETDPSTLKADIVICSDVIEHIENPDDLMEFLSGIEFKYLIISTPEREMVRGKRDYGPPENPSHYREWNTPEFKSYTWRWFTIIDHKVLRDKSISQVVICSKATLRPLAAVD